MTINNSNTTGGDAMLNMRLSAVTDFPHDSPTSPYRKRNHHHFKDNFEPPQKPPATPKDMKEFQRHTLEQNRIDGIQTFANLVLHDDEYEYDKNPTAGNDDDDDKPLAVQDDIDPADISFTSPTARQHFNHHLKDNFEPVDRIMDQVYTHTHTLPSAAKKEDHHEHRRHHEHHHLHRHHEHHQQHHRNIQRERMFVDDTVSAPFEMDRSLATDAIRRYSYDLYGDDAARQMRLAELET